jgi:hypothetical protein
MWFTKDEHTITVIEQPSPRELYEENRNELRVLNQQHAEAEKAIMEHCRIHKDPRVHFLFARGRWTMHARVNAMFSDPILQELHSKHAALLRERSAKLAELARLKQLCGQAVY